MSYTLFIKNHILSFVHKEYQHYLYVDCIIHIWFSSKKKKNTYFVIRVMASNLIKTRVMLTTLIQ